MVYYLNMATNLNKLALLISLAAPACSPSEALYVDSRFTDAEVIDIKAAAEEWNRATGADIDLVFGADVGNDSGRRIMVRASNMGDMSEHEQDVFSAQGRRAGN